MAAVFLYAIGNVSAHYEFNADKKDSEINADAP